MNQHDLDAQRQQRLDAIEAEKARRPVEWWMTNWVWLWVLLAVAVVGVLFGGL